MNHQDKLSAPLWEALYQYREQGKVSFHVPGHKDGHMYDRLVAGPLAEAMSIDATEITGLDDLHHPEGVIDEAQKLAARFFGAEQTWFLVGGSTAGNLALILTVCRDPGDLIIVQRNVHKSVIHGLMLARARVVFIEPQIETSSQLAIIPSVESVREALLRYPEAKAVLLTHPNYYGMGTSLAEVAELCHKAGVPLLVDEAHGAHYGLNKGLPCSALKEGADGAVQSTHKMLGALTMGSMLHVQGDLLDRTLLSQRLAMLQSSSPSYLIMASLDLCRAWLEQQGQNAFKESITAVHMLQEGLKQFQYIRRLEPKKTKEIRAEVVSNQASGGNNGKRDMNNGPYTSQDPYKVVLYDVRGLWSGYKLQEKLEEQGNVPEMSDERYTVLALGPGTSQKDVAHLLGSLHNMEAEMIAEGLSRFEMVQEGQVSGSQQIQTDFKTVSEQIVLQCEVEGKPEQVILHSSGIRQQQNREPDNRSAEDGIMQKQNDSPPEAKLSTWNIFAEGTISDPVDFDLTPIRREETEWADLEDCAGKFAAEMVIPYPPGIPLLYPGEKITPALVEKLTLLRDSGARFQGAEDGALTKLRIITN